MSGQRILLLGAHGFVGTRAMERYRDAIIVPTQIRTGTMQQLSDFVREQSPDVILNAAAISDISTCEENPEASYRANVELPVCLAKAAQAMNAKLISFSSDQVYTGCTGNGPYSEKDTLPTPTNLYARHKLEAEQRVLDIAPNAVMLRATWMYDMPVYGHANRGNLLANVLDALLHNRKLRFSAQEYRGITYVRQVVELLDRMIDAPGGVYNYGSENPLSMMETAQALLRALGVQRQAGELLEESDHRVRNLWMDCEKLRGLGICFDTTEQGFARCAADYRLVG